MHCKIGLSKKYESISFTINHISLMQISTLKILSTKYCVTNWIQLEKKVGFGIKYSFGALLCKIMFHCIRTMLNNDLTYYGKYYFFISEDYHDNTK